jgi:hypothetical protein
MELVLRRGIVLSGVVSAVDGTAVPGARVVAYVTVTGDYADGGPGRIWALQPEGGITGTRDRRSGTSRTTLSQQATTDASGRFVLAIRAEGPVRICTYGEGYRPIDRELGHVSDDVRDLVFEAEAVGQSDVVKLLCQGEPLRGAQVIVSDQSGSVEQPSLSYRTDSEGCVSTDWFVAGKLYAIILMGTEVPQAARDPRFLRWGGEREVDVASLPRKRP